MQMLPHILQSTYITPNLRPPGGMRQQKKKDMSTISQILRLGGEIMFFHNP